jgi:hypothetical protein
MTTDNFYFYLQNRQIQTRQTGGQRYNDTFPFSIPLFPACLTAGQALPAHMPNHFPNPSAVQHVYMSAQPIAPFPSAHLSPHVAAHVPTCLLTCLPTREY